MTVLDLLMTAGGLPVESFSYSAERGTGERLDVTVIGDTRGQPVPPISVQAGGQGAVFLVGGTLPEWEAKHDAGGWTTTLHATDRALIPSAFLPELVPWEAQGDKDARTAQERALKVAKVPPAHRAAALRDGRRMAVDAVVAAALATVPHRLLTAAPWPGYDFRADGGPSYRTEGKTAQQVVQDLWGMLGITAGWEGGLLTIRPPGPAGDLLLASPVETETIERITLDAPALELKGGVPSDFPKDDGENGADPNDPDNNPDRDSSDSPENSADPDERDGNLSGGFSEGISPTPVAGELSANAVPLSWDAVPHASQYVLERVEGFASPYTLWSRIAITTATRATDDTVRPLTTYTYRLTVNATAIAGSETQNVIWQPSGNLLLTTPPLEVTAPPAPVTDLEGYWRNSISCAVKWTAPLADPPDGTPPLRGPADRYRVRAYRGLELVAEVVTMNTYAVLDGMPVGALVRVRVEARNQQGDSVPTELDVQLVNLRPAPATPPELTVSGQSLTATWEPVSGATAYEVQYAYALLGTLPGGLIWRPLPTVPVPPVPADGPAAKPSTLIPGLEFETRYAVRVAASNELGNGTWSAAAYAVTESLPPDPEPDPESDDFERAVSKTLRFYRKTPTESESTVLVKQGGRMVSTVVDLWGLVPVYAREKGADGEKVVLSTSWKRLKTTSTRYFYEIPSWPLTLTGRVEETRLYGVEEAGGESNPLIGTEQEKITQEWSPQGWLKRRFTARSKAAVMKVLQDSDGLIIKREYGNQHEYVTERWQPVGDGLWFYQRSGVYTALLPTLTDGEWEDLEPGFKATPSESSVSEQGPEQAVLPREKQEEARQKGAPPLPGNPNSPAVDAYPLDAPWFTSVDAPSGPGAPPASPGDGDPGSDPLGSPTGPYDAPSSPGTGSGDPSGQPGPDLPPKATPKTDPVTLERPGPSENSPVLSATVPWVNTAQGLARAAQLMAQVGGPRFKVTRAYLLPVTPPSLDRVESISASGDRGQFSMTVVTLSR